MEFTDYFVAETRGRYPIGLTDLQGPLNSAYLVWEPTAFMVAMYTNPKEVHHLMRLMTDLIIAFVKEQRARSPQFLPCHFPPVWLPDGQGIAISEDCLAVLSPKLYREFALPYVNEISEEFGGVFIHSCGNILHQLDNLAQVHNLRGLNFGVSETPFAPVWERFGGKTAILPHLGLNKDFPFESHVEFIEHIFGVASHWRGLCLIVAPPALAAPKEGASHQAGMGPEISDPGVHQPLPADNQRDARTAYRRSVGRRLFHLGPAPSCLATAACSVTSSRVEVLDRVRRSPL